MNDTVTDPGAQALQPKQKTRRPLPVLFPEVPDELNARMPPGAYEIRAGIVREQDGVRFAVALCKSNAAKNVPWRPLSVTLIKKVVLDNVKFLALQGGYEIFPPRNEAHHYRLLDSLTRLP